MKFEDYCLCRGVLYLPASVPLGSRVDLNIACFEQLKIVDRTPLSCHLFHRVGCHIASIKSGDGPYSIDVKTYWARQIQSFMGFDSDRIEPLDCSETELQTKEISAETKALLSSALGLQCNCKNTVDILKELEKIVKSLEDKKKAGILTSDEGYKLGFIYTHFWLKPVNDDVYKDGVELLKKAGVSSFDAMRFLAVIYACYSLVDGDPKTREISLSYLEILIQGKYLKENYEFIRRATACKLYYNLIYKNITGSNVGLVDAQLSDSGFFMQRRASVIPSPSSLWPGEAVNALAADIYYAVLEKTKETSASVWLQKRNEALDSAACTIDMLFRAAKIDSVKSDEDFVQFLKALAVCDFNDEIVSCGLTFLDFFKDRQEGEAKFFLLSSGSSRARTDNIIKCAKANLVLARALFYGRITGFVKEERIRIALRLLAAIKDECKLEVEKELKDFLIIMDRDKVESAIIGEAYYWLWIISLSDEKKASEYLMAAINLANVQVKFNIVSQLEKLKNYGEAAILLDKVVRSPLVKNIIGDLEGILSRMVAYRDAGNIGLLSAYIAYGVFLSQRNPNKAGELFCYVARNTDQEVVLKSVFEEVNKLRIAFDKNEIVEQYYIFMLIRYEGKLKETIELIGNMLDRYLDVALVYSLRDLIVSLNNKEAVTVLFDIGNRYYKNNNFVMAKQWLEKSAILGNAVGSKRRYNALLILASIFEKEGVISRAKACYQICISGDDGEIKRIADGKLKALRSY